MCICIINTCINPNPGINTCIRRLGLGSVALAGTIFVTIQRVGYFKVHYTKEIVIRNIGMSFDT